MAERYLNLHYEENVDVEVTESEVRNWLIDTLISELKSKLGTLSEGDMGYWQMASYMIDNFNLVDDLVDNEDSIIYQDYHEELLNHYESLADEIREENEKLHQEYMWEISHIEGR